MKALHSPVNHTNIKKLTTGTRYMHIRSLLLSACLLANASFATHTFAATGTSQPAFDGVIALVDETPILQSDLAEAMRTAKAALRAQNKQLPPNDTLAAQVLDRLITRTTQLNLIKQQGQRINNRAVNETILGIAAKKGIGNLSDFQVALEAKQPGSYAALRQQIREELTIQQLKQQELNKRVRITEQDIDYFLRSPESDLLHKTEYRTYHVRVSVPENKATKAQRKEALKIATQIKKELDAGKSVEDVVQRYRSQTELPVQGGDMGFHAVNSLPAHLRHEITVLNVGQSTRPIAHSDGVHIVSLKDKKSANTQVVHQWKIRHILVKPNEITSLAQAKHKIDELYEKLRRDGNFTTLASTYSDDPGSARKGGSLEWVSVGQMVPEFDAMMQRTPAGDYSTPFQTQFGWHILKVEAERDQDMSEQFKRNVARETLFKRMSSQAIEDWMQELRANSHITMLDPRFKS